MTTALPKKLAVSPDEIRAHFNCMRLYCKAARGCLLAVVQDEYRAPASANQLPGTVAQVVYYYERIPNGSRRRIAIVHQYLQRDGSLGASGKPDPKWLLLSDCTVLVPTR